MKNNNYCHGCGYQLQTEEKNKLGYIPKFKEADEIMYCIRCYKMIYRNEPPKVFLDNEKYWELFCDIMEQNKLYILVLDAFNIEGSIIKKMLHQLKNKKILLVINKRDLLPKLINDKKIEHSIKNHHLLKNLTFVDFILVSAKKKKNIDELLNKIEKHKNGDVYVIGAANVGKSSLINALINSVLQENKKYISTSYYPGTTLGMIKIPLDKKNDLIDTPGIINEEDINNNLTTETLKVIMPQKEVKLTTYQLNEQQTLFITGFCQLDYLKGNKQGFTIYAPSTVKIHRTKYDNSFEFRKNNLGKNIIIPPNKEELKKIKFKTEELKISGKNVDLVISGLCFINFKNIKEDLKLQLTIPKHVGYYIRKGLV